MVDTEKAVNTVLVNTKPEPFLGFYTGWAGLGECGCTQCYNVHACAK